jgi:hypothetical protein
VIRFEDLIGVCHAAAGARRRAAGGRSALAPTSSSHGYVQMFVDVDSLTPQGGAKAP